MKRRLRTFLRSVLILIVASGPLQAQAVFACSMMDMVMEECAQRMNFTLAEIGKLLEMREDPQNARTDVRALMQKKLQEVEEQLEDLNTLRNEMRLLINLCRGANDGCPIIEDIDHGE